MLVIVNCKAKKGKEETSDVLLLTRAEISSSGGIRGGTTHTSVLTVFRRLGESRPEMRELLSSGRLIPSKNDSVGVENSSASSADKFPGSEVGRVVTAT